MVPVKSYRASVRRIRRCTSCSVLPTVPVSRPPPHLPWSNFTSLQGLATRHLFHSYALWNHHCRRPVNECSSLEKGWLGLIGPVKQSLWIFHASEGALWNGVGQKLQRLQSDEQLALMHGCGRWVVWIAGRSFLRAVRSGCQSGCGLYTGGRDQTASAGSADGFPDVLGSPTLQRHQGGALP